MNRDEHSRIARFVYASRWILLAVCACNVLAPSPSALAASGPLVESEFVTYVSATGATFSAVINPHGVSTAYRLEYGLGTSYGQAVSGTVGESSTNVLVSVHREGLRAGSLYHYRFVASSECEPSTACSAQGVDSVLVTQAANNEESLPDGRGWELVSPADKRGGLIEPTPAGFQAAFDGRGIAYVDSTPLGSRSSSSIVINPTVSLRSNGEWVTVSTAPAVTLPQGQQSDYLVLAAGLPVAYSPDLSFGVFNPAFHQLPTGFGEKSAYVHGTVAGSAIPLVTCANVEELICPAFGGEDYEGHEMDVLGGTSDLRYIVIESPYALVAPAVNGAFGSLGNFLAQGYNLYEWRAIGVQGCTRAQGCLALVNVLPDGQATPHQEDNPDAAYLARTDSLTGQAVSDDGRWIVWSARPSRVGEVELFVRDMVAGSTARVGGAGALYQAMSRDGSKVFYTENDELYVCEPAVNGSTGRLECAVSDLTTHHGSAASAGLRDALLGVSGDGSYIYVVATSVLAPGGASGEDNVYVMHYENGVWSVRLVAILSGGDEKDWFCKACGERVDRSYISSRVSPNGRFIAFMSERALTAYDNHDAMSGQPDEEVFLYDALGEAGRGSLVCVSCNPTGERPIGVYDTGPPFPLVDRNAIWTAGLSGSNHWLAANIPAWNFSASPGLHGEGAVAQYEARFVSDNGRVFFNSADGLVPLDTNGVTDVYEYEPVGGVTEPSSDSCSAGSTSYVAVAHGCVGLLSGGTSSEESVFMDASESGDDVFFLTASKLVSEDFDSSYDVYDVHVCSVSVACHVPSSPPIPLCLSSDSCKGAPMEQPGVFGVPASETFDGADSVEVSSKGVVQRAMTRAQRVAKALRACRHKRKRTRVVACERRARKRFRRAGASASIGHSARTMR